ncbi:MAG: mammalian cell entry protein [Sphingomonas sp. SCN 67-18]|uniref:MlaD family protein n=1 Tax=uncultured Sphingomonas sp. TaxID=158754 RepID=UPI00086C9A07|nr:MlaD family protein [Sphingomonas sp. SCN 67-18]ODU20259.1 MAG: mammalian cell entry protein [Sphingomonas sp. SCN 67-18]
METRSNQVLVGSVVMILLIALLASVVWLARLSGKAEKEYDIFFKQSVDGLAKGSGVSFSGVPSGQVKEIALWKNDPQFVRVRISVNEEVPVLQGTTATIQGVGFTGVSQIQLDGAVKGAPPIVDLGPADRPVIPTKPGALGELLNNAPKLLERLTTLTERLTELLSDRNQASIAGILKNVQTLSGSLAARGPEIAATLAQTRVAIEQAGNAAEQIGQLAGTTNSLLSEDARPLVADLRVTVKRASESMANLDAAITDARPGLQAFSKQTIPEVDVLVRDLRDMAESLTAVSERLNQGGAGSLIGNQKLPDYKAK